MVAAAIACATTIACSDDSTSSSVDGSDSASDTGENNSGDGDGDSGDGDGDSGDGDGDSGDGDGDSGDGDGDGDGDSGDGDGDSGDGDGDGDGDSGDGDGDSGDGDGDSGDGDGDGDACDPNAFVGQALADDPWAQGSLCDEIWVCATADQAQMLTNLIGVQCEPGNGCAEQHCTLSYQTIASAQNVADACTALSLPGIDAVYCVVYGP
jgi:hypothetical protein